MLSKSKNTEVYKSNKTSQLKLKKQEKKNLQIKL